MNSRRNVKQLLQRTGNFYFLTSCVVLLIGIVIFFAWFMETGPRYFSMDLHGHAKYIRTILHKKVIPMPGEGWLGYQQPLYYIIGAAFLSLQKTGIELSHNLSWVRFFSLICFATYLIYGIKTFLRLQPGKVVFVASVILLVLWPANPMIATRVDSNLLLYTLMSISLYHMVCWHQTLEQKHLTYGLSALAVGLITRTNAFTMLAAWAALIAYHWFVTKRLSGELFFNRRTLFTLLVLCLAIAGNMSRYVYVQYADGKEQRWLVGNADGLGKNTHAPSDVVTLFATFPVSEYFRTPYLHVKKNKPDRDNFWSPMLKTSLFGEFRFKQWKIARVLAYLLLILVTYLMVVFLFYRRRDFEDIVPFILVVGASMAGLMYTRWNVEAAAGGDFRYIYFTLIAIIGVFHHHTHLLARKIGEFSYVASLVFALTFVTIGLVIYLSQIYPIPIYQ